MRNTKTERGKSRKQKTFTKKLISWATFTVGQHLQQTIIIRADCDSSPS
jgi:hypothetical protein